MTTPAKVMETFKNLIRHGKHAHEGQRRQPKQPDPPQPQPAAAAAPRKATTSKDYTHHAERIVQEELAQRKVKEAMPVYPGLERYVLVDKMGDGAFSNVYKAVDTGTGQKVAIKVVRKFELNASQEGNKHLDPKFKKRPRVTERANILKEVQIMRGTNHPNVVKLLSFSESEEHYFLVLELMEGGELFHQIVKLTYFSEPLARHVILQVAHGIRHLHEERGVVHRDIKPENLLFDRIPIIPSKAPAPRQFDEEKEDEGEFVPGKGGGGIGQVKIADFGLSKVVWEETTKTPCGTVGYTAPEIVKDERYSKSVDMWALGCVLYTLLCGFPPFYDESINVLTEKVARGYYTFLSPWWDTISLSAKDLITHLLCVDPTARYTIDEFLAHPWCQEAGTTAVQPQQPATLAIQRQPGPLDSPLLQSLKGHAPVRSPGVAALKEAFDVTYAVHRMEEEGGRRNRGAGGRGFLGGLNEESDEDEEGDDADDESSAQQHQNQSTGAKTSTYDPAAGGRAGARDLGPTRGKKPVASENRGFDLKLGDATLLGRRHRRAVAEPSPLGGNSVTNSNAHQQQNRAFALGSPMRGIE